MNFDDTVELNKLVVLDPQWLIDVFKTVVTVKRHDRMERGYNTLHDEKAKFCALHLPYSSKKHRYKKVRFQSKNGVLFRSQALQISHNSKKTLK